MSQIFRYTSRILGLLFFWVYTLESFAQVIVIPPEGVQLPEVGTDPGTTVAMIIQYFILLASVLAVMAITWGGIMFILSSGDEEKVKKSKKIVIYAFVGVILTGLAYAIVSLVTSSQIIAP